MRDYLYINLQSESDGGCQVIVRASFKRENASLSKVAVKDSLDGDPSKTDRSAASPTVTARGPGDQNQDSDLNFNTWSLGNGKLKDKRVKLENFVRTLMDKNNKKLKQSHDAYCKMIKRKRNRGLTEIEN